MEQDFIHTIRIHADDRVGTGLLYFPVASSYIYVLTAEHVLYAKDRPAEATSPVVSLQKITHPSLSTEHYAVPASTRLLRSPNPEHDLAIIVLDKSAFEGIGSPSSPPAVESNYGLETCFFAGFPNYANGEIRKERGTFEGNPGMVSDRFLVRSSFPLDDTYNVAADNVRGASGAGLFLPYEKQTYLVGIITDFTPIDSFYATGIKTINDLLSSNGLPCISTVDLVVDAELKAVHHNNKAIEARIKSNIGTVHVTRTALNDNRQPFHANRLFIVHGNAGAGKSAFARDLVAKVRDEYELFLFTGEQFSSDTLELVFQRLPMPISSPFDTLLNNPTFKKKKLFWIESAEKLIESDKLGALIELLEKAKRNPNLTVLMTVRTYMVDILQLNLAFHLPQGTAVVPIANFTDEELALVEAVYPDLRVLLARNRINNLLHVPFYLTYAVRLLHRLKEEEDLTEMKFREIIWREVIENGSKERGEVFEALAVRRAKEMSLYTQVAAPAELIESLYKDHLILVENDELRDRYCPAHDILEDWALMRYIYRHKRNATSPEAFFTSVGNELPIRRAFRLWISEALQDPKKDITDFINETVSNTAIANHWKDELYISILQSDYSENFIARNTGILIENNQRLAYKFINLLKTACKETRKNADTKAQTHLIGAGWSSMIRFIYRNRSEFDRNPFAIVFFLIEWGHKLYKADDIEQEEGQAAGLLCMHLLNQVAGSQGSNITYSGASDLIVSIIKLAFDLARYIPGEVLCLLTTARDYPRGDRTPAGLNLREYYDQVLLLAISGPYCKELCQQFPDRIIELFDQTIRPASLAELDQQDRWGNPFEQKVEFHFGLKYNFEYKCSPASSLQTPLYWLLSTHPAKALRYIIGLLNYCVDTYTKSSAAADDSIVLVEITLNDGSKVSQTGSGLLWQAYRGLNNYTPSILQSILMALEKWMFDLAGCARDLQHKKIRQVYKFLYHKSLSVCPTAVMASVALKYPTEVGDLMLPMFSSPEILWWDANRALAAIPGSLFRNWGEKDVHDLDRQQSDALPHRRIRNGLGRLMLHWQGESPEIKGRIWAILDNFQTDAAAKQQAYWQKFLTEIDVRKYKVEELPGNPGIGVLTPDYEGKAKEIVDQGQEELKRTGPETAYREWINKTMTANAADDSQFSFFQEMLTYYRGGKILEPVFARPGSLAVIGLRHFYNQLNTDELDWCIETIVTLLQHLILSREHWDYDKDTSHFNILDVEPVLYFVPFLIVLSKRIPEKEIRLKSLFCHLILAPLHAHELSKLFHAARKDLWSGDEEFGYRCFILLLAYGALADENSGWRNSYGEPDLEKQSSDTDDLIRQVWKDVHSITLTFKLGRQRSHYYSRAITFVPAKQDLEIFRKFVKSILELHLDAFNGGKGRETASLHFDDRQVISQFVPRILLAQPQAFGKSIIEDLYKQYNSIDPSSHRWAHRSDKDKFIEAVIKQFIYAIHFGQDSPEEGMQVSVFWEYWRQIDGLNRAGDHQYFANELLLNVGWSSDVVDWPPLEGRTDYIIELINYYGPQDLSLVINLLASIGDKTLMPKGISLVVRICKSSHIAQTQLFGNSSTKLILRAFHRHGRVIRSDRALLDDFIFLLDKLTESGNSEAFFIREDIITFHVE